MSKIEFEKRVSTKLPIKPHEGLEYSILIEFSFHFNGFLSICTVKVVKCGFKIGNLNNNCGEFIKVYINVKLIEITSWILVGCGDLMGAYLRN